jgi:DNA-binding CsgD family transcriptional regulator
MNLAEMRELLLANSRYEEGPLATACLIWLWGCTGDGYGAYNWQGQQWKVHRLAYLAFVGAIEDELQINHHCDVRPCLNWEHLYMGPQTQNMQDRFNRERDSRQLLNPTKVEQVKLLLIENRLTCDEIGDRYGVSGNDISGILRLERWAYVRPDLNEKLLKRAPLVGSKSRYAKLTDAKALELKQVRLARPELTVREIAEIVGVDKGIANQVLRGNTWRHIGPVMVPRPSPRLLAHSYDKAIEELTDKGLSNAETADRLGIRRELVNSVCRRIRERRERNRQLAFNPIRRL